MNDREDKDKYDEEGEYHFSDDQVNYEPEEEAKDKAAAPTDIKELLTSKFSQNRRIILGGVVFAILLVVVYTMLVPTSTVPNTQISQATQTTTTRPAATAAAQPAAAQPVAAASPAVQQPAAAPVMAETAIPVSQPNPLAAPTLQQPTAAAPQVQAMTTTTTVSTPTDKLNVLEQENARLMTLLQSDYAQKMSEQQAQNSALQGRIQELTNRIAVLESNLVKMTQMLQAANNRPAAPPCQAPCAAPAPCAGPCSVRNLGPRIAYTVQAIIPGRAWLKSDVGDTITVAEGDVLRCVGRVTKIDPYDGVVQIDTGNRILTLSYGVNAD